MESSDPESGTQTESINKGTQSEESYQQSVAAQETETTSQTERVVVTPNTDGYQETEYDEYGNYDIFSYDGQGHLIKKECY